MEVIDRESLISVFDLLSWEEDKMFVVNYVGKKISGVSTASLRVRYKIKNVKKEGSSSNPVKGDGGVEVNQPIPKRRKIVFKKKKTDLIDVDVSNYLLENGKEILLEELTTFVSNQETLHGFADGGDGSSVWDKNFSFMVVADETFQSSSNVTLVNEVVEFRLASIGRSREVKHKKLLEKTDKLACLREDLNLKNDLIAGMKKKFS
nr:uncharacterized protein LOC112763227 [Arachis hypogaea]